jgi:hypothetical protein
MKVIGIILLAIGILLLVYKGITYSTHEKVLDVGPLEVSQEKTKSFPISPVVGGIAVVGGIVLIAASGKRKD